VAPPGLGTQEKFAERWRSQSYEGSYRGFGWNLFWRSYSGDPYSGEIRRGRGILALLPFQKPASGGSEIWVAPQRAGGSLGTRRLRKKVAE